MFDVLVLNYNDSETTIKFVKSVKDYFCVDHILVVDNKSSDDSIQKLNILKSNKINVIQTDRNGGYGAGNNFGIRYLREHFNSEYILLCNPDVIIDEQTCKNLEDFLRTHNDYAVAAPFMLDSSGVKQNNTAFRIPSTIEYILSLSVLVKRFLKNFDCGFIADKSLEQVFDVGSVSGSLFMMNADKMIRYGMFDEKIFLYCEEIVLGIKFRNADLKIALLPNLSFVHNHSVSIRKSFKTQLSRHRLYISSKLFVIKEYFKANKFAYLVAYVLSRLSLFEVAIISLIRDSK